MPPFFRLFNSVYLWYTSLLTGIKLSLNWWILKAVIFFFLYGSLRRCSCKTNGASAFRSFQLIWAPLLITMFWGTWLGEGKPEAEDRSVFYRILRSPLVSNALIKHSTLTEKLRSPKAARGQVVKEFLWHDKVSHDFHVDSEVKWKLFGWLSVFWFLEVLEWTWRLEDWLFS